MRARVFKCQNEEEEGGRWKVEGVKLSFPALERVDARRCKMCRERERVPKRFLKTQKKSAAGALREKCETWKISRATSERGCWRAARRVSFGSVLGFHCHF